MVNLKRKNMYFAMALVTYTVALTLRDFNVGAFGKDKFWARSPGSICSSSWPILVKFSQECFSWPAANLGARPAEFKKVIFTPILDHSNMVPDISVRGTSANVIWAKVIWANHFKRVSLQRNVIWAIAEYSECHFSDSYASAIPISATYHLSDCSAYRNTLFSWLVSSRYIPIFLHDYERDRRPSEFYWE